MKVFHFKEEFNKLIFNFFTASNEFKSGDKKGRLNLAAMSKKFKKGKGRK